VDCGDFGSLKSEFQQHKIGYLLRGMALLNYDAINLGERDLQYGKDFLARMQSKHNLPFISANVLLTGSGRRFTDAYVIKRIGKVKVGIFGITTTAGAKRFVKPETGFQISDPFVAAQETVAELQKSCDVIIALAHLGVIDAKKLASTVPGIDIVIAGHGWNRSESPTMIGNTALMMTGDKGKYIGHLDFLTQTGKVNIVQGKIVALNDQISDEPQLAQLVKTYEDEVVYLYPTESPKAQETFSTMTEKTCMRCHRRQSKQWKTTAHAQAWQALVRDHKQSDEQCQACHTTMAGEPEGFVSAPETPHLANVQCVECHRPIGDVQRHLKNFRRKRFASKDDTTVQKPDFKPVEEARCLKCHTEDNSPEFDYAAYVKRVRH